MNSNRYEIVVLGTFQQQAEALRSQFSSVAVLFNKARFVRNAHEMNTSSKVDYIPYYATSSITEYFEIRKALKKLKPSFIYVNGFRQLLPISLMLSNPFDFKRKPIILATSHNPMVWESAYKRKLMAFLFDKLTDGVFTIASFQETWLRKLGLRQGKISTIHNPVDTKQFSCEINSGVNQNKEFIFHGTPILVTVANLLPRKGQDVVIRAIMKLTKEFPDIHLVLTGEDITGGAYKQKLIELVESEGLQKHVSFIGDVSHERVPSLLASVDISVLSSFNEVCPYIILESLACGRATIATTVGGNPDLIKDRFNGMLVPPGNEEALASAIRDLCLNSELKKNIEINARRTAEENFSIDVIGKKHRIFLEMIESKRS